MDSTFDRGERANDHSPVRNGDTARSKMSGSPRLADILLAHHEQLIAHDAPCIPGDDNSLAGGEGTLSPELTDELAELDACLVRLEQARRATLDHSATGTSPDAPHESEQADLWDVSVFPGASRAIGRFQIVRELGRGGLGIVLLAYDPMLRRHVALKVPHVAALVTRDLRKRFEREAQAAARLTHPRIVPVFEVGEIGPICYIAAAYVTGVSLADWLKSNTSRAHPRHSAALIAELADAMHYAHSQQVLHRDLKPGNVLLEGRSLPTGSSSNTDSLAAAIPKITDFGLAKLLDRSDDNTRSGVVLGTPAYMAPEQAAGGSDQVGPAADIYSLGAILYELLTGGPPFGGRSDAQTLLQVVSQELVIPASLSRELPRDLQAICRRCLEKHPAQRYADAGELANDLRRFLRNEPTRARPLSTIQRLGRWGRRHPTGAALAALLAIAVGACLAGLAYHTSRLNQTLALVSSHRVVAESQRELARRQEQRANAHLYGAQMRLASIALKQGDLDVAGRLISPYGPGQPLVGLAGLEWHLLKSELDAASRRPHPAVAWSANHPDEVYAVQFAPGGQWLVTGGKDGRIRKWDTATGRMLDEFASHTSCVNQIRFTADGTKMASASCDHSLVLWEVVPEGAPRPIHTFRSTQAVRCVAFSPDEQWLAAGDDASQVTVHEVASGRTLSTHNFGPHGIGGVSWSPDARQLAVRTQRGQPMSLRFWVWQTTQPPEDFGISAANVVYSPDGTRLAVNDAYRRIRQFDAQTLTELTSLEADSVGLVGVAWSGDSHRLATMGHKGNLRVYDSNTGRLAQVINVHDSNAKFEELTFSPDGHRIASLTRSGTLCVSDLSRITDVAPTLTVEVSKSDTFFRLYFSERFDEFSVCDSDRVRTWSLPMGRLARETVTRGDHGPAWWPIAANPTHAYFAPDDCIVAFDLARGTYHQSPPMFVNLTRAYAFPHSPILVTFAADKNNPERMEVIVVDARQWRVLYRESRPGQARFAEVLALSPLGSQLVLPKADVGGHELIDLPTGTKRLLPESGGGISHLSFSPDGRLLAAVEHLSFEVRLWDLQSFTLRHRLQGHKFYAETAFTADSRVLAIAADREIRFVHVDTGQELHSLRTPPLVRGQFSLHFSKDGRNFALVTRNPDRAEVYRWGPER